MADTTQYTVARISRVTDEELAEMQGKPLPAVIRKFKLAYVGMDCDPKLIRHISKYIRKLTVKSVDYQVFKRIEVLKWTEVDGSDLDLETSNPFTKFVEKQVKAAYGKNNMFVFYPLPQAVADVIQRMGYPAALPDGDDSALVYSWM